MDLTMIASLPNKLAWGAMIGYGLLVGFRFAYRMADLKPSWTRKTGLFVAMIVLGLPSPISGLWSDGSLSVLTTLVCGLRESLFAFIPSCVLALSLV